MKQTFYNLVQNTGEKWFHIEHILSHNEENKASLIMMMNCLREKEKIRRFIATKRIR